MRKTTLVGLLLVLPFMVMAQQTQNAPSLAKETWNAGLFLGYSNVLGDLVVPKFTFNNPNFAYGFFISQDWTNRLAWRANFYSGRLNASDSDYDENRVRNTDFSTALIELGFNGEYSLIKKIPAPAYGAPFKLRLVPYLTSGLGLGFINPSVSYGGVLKTEEAQDRAAKKPKTNLVIPMGIGVKADLSRNIYLGLEFGYRLTFTDYIDGVKVSGDPKDKDAYNIGGISLGFHLSEKDTDRDGVVDTEDKCPTIAGKATLQGCPDADEDGVADKNDKCPDVAGLKHLEGCPDKDGDGIADAEDTCPDVAGSVRFSGCPDTDGDGIPDKEDKCPTVAGISAQQGCPDNDGDGVINDQDQCPDQAGPASMNGCPDQDKDGIADKDDECPTIAGWKQFNGCPDSDNDGVEDRKDKCPNTFGLQSNNGCPEIKSEDKAILAFAMSNVNFETNSAKLLPSSLEVLDKVAEVMQRYPEFKLMIEGHTDDVGDAAANQRLSENRVQTCALYLQSKGINAANLRTQGFGESKPIADNRTPAGRKQNRRVEFRVEQQ
ncbi:DUF6089 family protein [Haliscomenobacter sp.]|uniref:DUF6089 family protein n=1 Tax=Haliscomenobacter sp. TaxID=2717303 RepID=UPI003BAA697C